VSTTTLSRRRLLTGSALVFGFSLPAPVRLVARQMPRLPGDLEKYPLLDSWIHIDRQGRVTVLTGKAELGQGLKTALLQLAAEELGLDPQRIALITADTALTPNEGYTAGSHSMQDSGTTIRAAAAEVREILLAAAAARLGVPAERLTARDGAVIAVDGRRIGFGELVGAALLHVPASAQVKLKDPRTYRIVGTSLPRVDIPAKVGGGIAFIQDLRLPGMVHGRVVRPPSPNARLRAVKTEAVEKLPGVVKIVRDGSYLAVIAEREFEAVVAMRALAAAASWDERPSLPDQHDIYRLLRSWPERASVILDTAAPAAPPARRLAARYRRPYQMHGAIGPSCALALFADGALTVWTHSQGVYPLRGALAELLRLPQDKVHCIQVEGSGCYGHNGADDVAADAALLARAYPGRPVRVQWMREDEHLWEPYGPAMVGEAKAALDRNGRIVAWEYDVWSNTHTTRPGRAGNLMPAWLLAQPFAPPPPHPIPLPEGGGDRNAIPLYGFPNARVTSHFVPRMPLRVSALRSLGAYTNIFAIESFIDELAKAAPADPVAFRLRHLDDPRARAVVMRAARRFGWSHWRRKPDSGRGFAFARYKNLGAYLALALAVEIDRASGHARVRHVVAAVDSGQAINPDGIRNQIEGGIVQSLSWSLHEAVHFDHTRITSRDWNSYPILRFPEAPDSIEVEIVERPGRPFLGTGEAAQGPTAAALANAVADATGARLRDLPLTPERIQAAIGI
jgi:nicotinate dehydrogenase subunit B